MDFEPVIQNLVDAAIDKVRLVNAKNKNAGHNSLPISETACIKRIRTYAKTRLFEKEGLPFIKVLVRYEPTDWKLEHPDEYKRTADYIIRAVGIQS